MTIRWKVALVEDDRRLARAVSAGLGEEGYTVRSVDSADRGLQLVRQWNPDVVLLDLMLPDQGGVGFRSESLEELRAVVVGQHQVKEDNIRIPLADELQAAVGRVDRTHRVALVAETRRDRPCQAAVILHERDFPSNSHRLPRRHSPTEPAPERAISRNGRLGTAVQHRVGSAA